MGIVQFARARDRLLAADGDTVPSVEVCGAILHAVRDVARFSAASVMTTDPETMLPSGGVVEGFAPPDCTPFWDNELLDPDFNKFTDLARSVEPVATLVDATDGDLCRSPRYLKLYEQNGVADELRIAFCSGSTCLAVGAFVRAGEDGAYTPEELADVRQLVPVGAKVLRRALGRMEAEACREAPGVIILEDDGTVSGMSEGARQLLADLRNDIDGEIPGVISAAATRARWSRASSELATRIRGRSGRWFRVHVSPMEGDVGRVVVTIETAHPDDLARILLDSYGLTARETDIAMLLARGLATKEIGAELAISTHTVRDHTKVVYDKAGVSSRGELMATLFANHVLDSFHSAVTHLG